MKKILSFLIIFIGLGIGVTYASPFNQAYNNCLCRCGCTAIGSNCNTVSCTFNTKDYDASPSCAEPANGPCKCEGFGCFRAPIVNSGVCYDECQKHLTSESCQKHKDEYEIARKSYLDNINGHQDLINFQYKLVGTIRNNTTRLGIRFVANHLGDAATSMSKLIADQVKDAILDKLDGDTTDKLEVQKKLIALNSSINNKRIALRAEQKIKMNELKGIVSSMKKDKCNYDKTESLPLLPDTKDLVDVRLTTPRELKINSLKQLGVVKGYADGEYKSNKTINRAEFLKILMESKFPDESNGADCFSDVNGEWYARYVCTAKRKGIISGYQDGTFRPGNDINSVEALKIIMETMYPDKINKEDVGGEWWKKYWKSALDEDVLVEDVKAQTQLINRGQMAEMIYNAMSDDIMNDLYEQSVSELETLSLDNLVEDVIIDNSDDEITPPDTSNNDFNEINLNASFSKDGEYTFSYPKDTWILTEKNATHKILSEKNGDAVIFITETGYSYERIKELVREELLGLGMNAEIIEEVETPIYYILGQYEDENGKIYIKYKMVIPNNKGTYNIWDLQTSLDDYEMNFKILEEIVKTWVFVD